MIERDEQFSYKEKINIQETRILDAKNTMFINFLFSLQYSTILKV